jgi:hypothetical protein
MDVMKPHFRQGLCDWWSDLKRIPQITRGVEKWADLFLYSLTLLLFSQWLHIGWGTKDRPASWMIDIYVLVGVIVTVWGYLSSSFIVACFSVYFTTSTVIVLLNVVFLRRIFGEPESVERSLLLFICNVVQITLMYATWYELGAQKDPLLRSVLTFATINYAEDMPNLAILQIATNFLLLAIFLSHLIGQVGDRRRLDIVDESSQRRAAPTAR